jgi:hypothetical protein
MSWDPDSDILPVPLHEAVSPMAITIALAVPLLLLARALAQFA